MNEVSLDKVRAAVRDSGYKTGWLADRIGVDRSTLTRFVSGKSRLGRPALILLSQIIKIES